MPGAESQRLDRWLSEALGISRSDAKQLLSGGAVCVNGAVCRKGDTHVLPQDEVSARGRVLSRQAFVYIMLDKPRGVVSASEDGRDTTVVDLVRPAWPRRELFPAGRLDKDSTGFVLLTDDGPFAHAILAPRRHVSKTYLVRIDCPLTGAMAEGFAAGVTLADGRRLAPARLEPVSGDAFLARVVLTQGVYHQIKRMFGTFGAGVVELRRIAVGPVQLDPALGPGGWRELTPGELQLLRGEG